MPYQKSTIQFQNTTTYIQDVTKSGMSDNPASLYGFLMVELVLLVNLAGTLHMTFDPISPICARHSDFRKFENIAW